jgi:N-methylhydantoinase A
VFLRAALRPGISLAGPAVIVEDGTATIVPTGFAARIAAGQEIVIEEPAA